jgi:prepilin-type N-terminal cleavage/methylation domain-containing protein
MKDRNSSIRAQSPGFTLVEMMIAVLLMALFASAAALSFSHPLRKARSRDAIEQLRSFDTSSRIFATRHNRGVRLVFDLTSNTLSRRERSDGADVSRMTWPSGYWA